MFSLFIELNDFGGTLQDQIYRVVRGAILQKRLLPGRRLPSSRELANQLHVSRNTVTLAYERLRSEGYLETRSASGTFVAETVPESCLAVAHVPSSRSESPGGVGRRSPIVFAGQRPSTLIKSEVLPIDFWYGRGNPDNFPRDPWRRLFLKNLARLPSHVSEYVSPAGLEELRKAIAYHLGETRGIEPSWQQVVITAGAQEAFEIIAKLFISVGARVVVEDPCYQGAAYAFRSHAAELVSVPVDQHGLDLSTLETIAAATLVYTTPSHQFPTGATLPLERRLRLLQWARRAGAHIIEDDYDSDFRYDGPPLPSMAALDDHGRTVIYVGTFSKSLGAGMRLGFLIAPPDIVEAALTAKTLTNHGQPWLEQAVLADFISSGGYRRHIRRLRHALRQARDVLVRSLRKCFGEVALTGSQGGMHVLWRLPAGFPRAAILAAEVRKLGVGLYPPGAAGAHITCGSYETDTLLLGYSALSEAQIEEGILRISKAIERLGRHGDPPSSPPSPSRVGKTGALQPEDGCELAVPEEPPMGDSKRSHRGQGLRRNVT